MTQGTNQVSLRAAALIAGVATLIMTICAPFAELYAYPKLIIAGNAEETVRNLTAHPGLFTALIMGYLVTFILDIVVAWALYILLRPVNSSLSALTALLRLVFATIAIISLLNLVNSFRLITTTGASSFLNPAQLQTQTMLSINAFRNGFHFGLILFGIYLGLLGYLVLISKYIPRVLGLLLIIAGLGYLATSLQPYLFASINMKFAVYTFYGEVIFMLWLLVRGWKIKEQVAN